MLDGHSRATEIGMVHIRLPSAGAGVHNNDGGRQTVLREKTTGYTDEREGSIVGMWEHGQCGYEWTHTMAPSYACCVMTGRLGVEIHPHVCTRVQRERGKGDGRQTVYEIYEITESVGRWMRVPWSTAAGIHNKITCVTTMCEWPA